MWSRRQFLNALGISGTAGASLSTAGALAPLLSCAAVRQGTKAATVSEIRPEDFADALAILDPDLEGAAVFSRTTTSFHVSIDHEEERFDRTQNFLVVLSGQRDGVTERVALHNPTPEGLREAANRFSTNASASGLKLQPLQSLGWNDARTLEHDDYRSPVRAAFSKAQKHGSSRIIYRSSYLHSVLTERRLLTTSSNLQSRSQRSRGGVAMATWAGNEVATGAAEISGRGGPKLHEFSEETLAGVAEETLAHLHARSAPEQQGQVLLSPQCAALLAHNAIARCPRPLPAPKNGAVRVVDDPSRGYGSLSLDDEGRRPAPHAIIGGNGAPLPAPGRRRFDDTAELRTTATHLRVESPGHGLEELMSHVKIGVLVESPELCVLNSTGERFSLLASKAREIRDGRLTGRLFARTLVAADLAKFVSSTIAFGDTKQTFAFESGGIGSSAEAPHWLSAATVRPA